MRNQRFHMSDSAYSHCSPELIQRSLKAGRITQQDADLITEFTCDIADGISPEREYVITDNLLLNVEFFKHYAGITTVEVQQGIRLITTISDENGNKRFKNNTIAERIRVSKRFFLWMIENGHGDQLNEKKIRNIVVPKSDRMTKTAADLLSKEEIEMLVKGAKTSRDRAMLITLYEAGLRGRELGDLTWRDLKFTTWNVVLNTAGKTGAPRYVPLVLARPYLAQWMNDYPGEVTPDSFVFVTLRKLGKDKKYLPITYSILTFIVTDIAKRIHMNRKVTPHLFRHSRITHLIQDGMPETFIKKMMWGNMTTNMFQTYAHIVNNDLDKFVAEMNGIVLESSDGEKKKERFLHPIQCPNCGTMNGSTAKHCNECGYPLSDEAKDKVSVRKAELEAVLADDSNYAEFMYFIRMRREELKVRQEQNLQVQKQ